MSNKRKKPDSLSLRILKVAGLGLAFTAAAMLSSDFLYRAAKHYVRSGMKARYSKKQIDQSLRYLKRKRFVALEKRTGKILLTKLGRKRLAALEVSDFTIEPAIWDGKWRMVAFDIPEEKSPARHILRRKLAKLGFFHFQRSVFIIPYPCEREICRLSEHLGVAEHVYVLTAGRFTGDERIAQEFRLKG